MLQDRSAAYLSALPLFAGWDPVSLQAIVYVNTRLILAPGDTLLRAGEAAQGAVIIVSGVAGPPETRTAPESGEADSGDAAAEEEDAAPREYGPGCIFDEMAMFVATASETGVVARTPLEALLISRDRMRDILRNDPGMAGILAERIQGRLIVIADRLRAVSELLGPAAGEAATEGKELSLRPDRSEPGPEYDRKDAPSPAPRQQPASNGTPPAGLALRRHGPAVAPGLNGASPVHGNSTR